MDTTEEKDLLAQLEKVMEANIELKTHIDHLNDVINSHEEQVDVYRDQLFELSQSQDDVSEDSIRNNFQSVFDGVEFWIDELSGKPGFDEQFAKRFAERLSDSRTQRDLSDLTNDADIDWFKVARSQNFSYIILSLAIGQCLEQNVFRLSEMLRHGHIYPPELRSEHMKFLSEVQGRIKSQAVENDVRASRWRSDAATAMILRGEDTARLKASVLGEMYEDITFWTDQPLSTEEMASLQTKIVDRALRALHMIAGSSKEYVFLGSGNKPGQYDSNSSEWKARDIYNWDKQPRRSAADGVVKVLYPGLARKKDSRGPGSTLVSPTFLVQRRKSRTPSPRKSGTKTPTSDTTSTKDAHTHTHIEHSRRSHLSATVSKERSPTTKSLQSADLVRGAESLVPSRSLRDFLNPLGFSSREKKQKVIKREESSGGTKSSSTFPLTRRHYNSTTIRARRGGGEVDPETEIQNAREAHSQEDYGSHDIPRTHGIDVPDVPAVFESYSRDPSTWVVGEAYGEPPSARSQHGRSYSMSY